MADAEEGVNQPDGDAGETKTTTEGAVTPVCLIAAPAGAGKTTALAAEVAEQGSTVWLANRIEDVEAVARLIEAKGRAVARVLPLDGWTGRERNCLYPAIIREWQAKGYDYKKGFCSRKCARRGEGCPFLESQKALEMADTIVCTKALAKTPGFFSQHGNARRRKVVIDEDPIGLLRPVAIVTRDELETYLATMNDVLAAMQAQRDAAGIAEAEHWQSVALWCLTEINAQPPNADPAPVDVPAWTRPSEADDEDEQRTRKAGRKTFEGEFLRRMRDDPGGTVRNLRRDFNAMARHAAVKTVYVTSNQLLFHVRITIPQDREVVILDATANPGLLRPLFYPRPVEVFCDELVEPAGRVVQLMDFNGPRSYVNKHPKKLLRIIDAIGDRHPEGKIVLIAHKSNVEELAAASRHAGRIVTGHFGALRGRNDLETRRGDPIAVHIVVGSPKTSELDRQQVALAVFGKAILPFPRLRTVRRPVLGNVPRELDDSMGRIWERKHKGYGDPKMQAVYDHTVQAELSQAADRARVLIHEDATVYVVTNEPLHKSLAWFAELCYADEILDLSPRRSDWAANHAAYVAKAKELLDGGGLVGNADVCRALGKSPNSGLRHWQEFRADFEDRLEGTHRKVRWIAL